MKLSNRAEAVNPSITLKLNARAVKMTEEGKHVYNLTAGQLPFKPMPEFTEKILTEANFLKSYQYSPVAGFAPLRERFIKLIEEERKIYLPRENYDCVISNGAKHTIYNVLGALVNPGDEVVLLAPHWISYPEMIRFWSGTPVVVKSDIFNSFTPEIDDIRKALTDKTSALILNSPNNPAGIHYSEEWMKEFAALMCDYPEVSIISDDIYYELCYFDPRPTYFYQHRPELLERTVIVDGISKCMAATGLRIGFCVGPRNLIEAIGRLQGQTTSGPNSLIQRALIDFDFDSLQSYLDPIRDHLRNNANYLREKMREKDLSHAWYQSTSAFYYLMDFSKTPVYARFQKQYEANPKKFTHATDYAQEICNALLEQKSLVMVPSTDFGIPNGARMSLVLEEGPFREAVERLLEFLCE